MNIILFIDSLGAGGAQRQLCGLACFLKESGYNVKVVSYYDHPFYLHLLEENDVEYECLYIKSYWCYFKLVDRIKAFHAEVVIAYQTVPSFIACVCRLMCKFKLIVSERNTNTRTTWKDHIFFRTFRIADYIVPNSYSQGDYIKQTFPFLTDKVKVICNFVDLSRFVPDAHRERHETKTLLVVASIKESKNTKTFIEAYKIAFSQGCKLHVKWYGIVPKDEEGTMNSYAKECLAMLVDYGLKDQIELLPKTKEIDKAYRQADIFCLPSLFEGTPNVICEAMASGLPIICSDVCDNHIYVKEGENGYLFNPRNPEDIAEKLLTIENLSDEKLKEMGHKSRHFVENLCSPEKFVDKYIKLIKG